MRTFSYGDRLNVVTINDSNRNIDPIFLCCTCTNYHKENKDFFLEIRTECINSNCLKIYSSGFNQSDYRNFRNFEDENGEIIGKICSTCRIQDITPFNNKKPQHYADCLGCSLKINIIEKSLNDFNINNISKFRLPYPLKGR